MAIQRGNILVKESLKKLLQTYPINKTDIFFYHR